MYKLKPNLFKLAVVTMTASLFTACTPTPVVQNQEICDQPQSAECKHSTQHGGGSGYVPIGRGGNRFNVDGNNSKTSQPRVSSPKSTGTRGSPSFSGKTGFGSFGRGGFGLG